MCRSRRYYLHLDLNLFPYPMCPTWCYQEDVMLLPSCHVLSIFLHRSLMYLLFLSSFWLTTASITKRDYKRKRTGNPPYLQPRSIHSVWALAKPESFHFSLFWKKACRTSTLSSSSCLCQGYAITCARTRTTWENDMWPKNMWSTRLCLVQNDSWEPGFGEGETRKVVNKRLY